MLLVNSVKNKVRAALSLYAPYAIKRAVWDRLFARIPKEELAHSAEGSIYPYLEKYAAGCEVLDLGCGTGTTGNEMAPNYTGYLGVDISRVALDQAEQLKAVSGRTQNRFVQADICSYQPERLYGVILFRDSLYYVPQNRIKAMLDRYGQYLKPEGVFLVRMHVANPKHANGIARIIRSGFTLIEEGHAPSPILAFRPRTVPV